MCVCVLYAENTSFGISRLILNYLHVVHVQGNAMKRSMKEQHKKLNFFP